ncbi:hypothetical protein [Echinimonas agarilytica]|uniref:Uncharacterized protein n=1 Tax=Echinimonas agarilytica TaxID=1215918 RepID=A0AA41W719_9GAMM|nr:hypothetical protein [Echinimonas agarilytica]MCM2680277.1 hypothetical protein [Echinimonas agarilytica]
MSEFFSSIIISSMIAAGLGTLLYWTVCRLIKMRPMARRFFLGLVAIVGTVQAVAA